MAAITSRDRATAAEAIYQLGASVLRRARREVNLTALSTMSTLERGGPRRVTELAGLQRVAQPTMTSLLKGLERDGYVERRVDPDDGRAMLAVLTDAGRAVVLERRRAGTEVITALIDELDDEDAAKLAAAVPVLRRLRELDEARQDA